MFIERLNLPVMFFMPWNRVGQLIWLGSHFEKAAFSGGQ